MTLAIDAYFFFIAFILAHLEIQIEGPHGWTEKLPHGDGTAPECAAGSESIGNISTLRRRSPPGWPPVP